MNTINKITQPEVSNNKVEYYNGACKIKLGKFCSIFFANYVELYICFVCSLLKKLVFLRDFDNQLLLLLDPFELSMMMV